VIRSAKPGHVASYSARRLGRGIGPQNPATILTTRSTTSPRLVATISGGIISSTFSRISSRGTSADSE
jgi:hypothetical protein